MTLLGGTVIMLLGVGFFLGGLRWHDWGEAPSVFEGVTLLRGVAGFFGVIIAFLGFMMFIVPPIVGLSYFLRALSQIGG